MDGDFEIREQNAMRERIGKGDIGFTGAGEIGVEFDGVADVDGDQERRPAVFGRERQHDAEQKSFPHGLALKKTLFEEAQLEAKRYFVTTYEVE